MKKKILAMLAAAAIILYGGAAFATDTESPSPVPTYKSTAEQPSGALIPIETALPDITTSPTQSEAPINPEAPSAEPAATNAPSAPPSPTRIIYAVQSNLMCINDSVTDMWDRPYVYNETTYIPLRNAVESLGGAIEYDETQRMINAVYKGNSFSISIDDERLNVFYGVSFIPIRDLCTGIGVTLNWFSGIITISDDGFTLTDEEVEHYKELLNYQGYTDEFFLPRSVVDPYVTYSYEQMNYDIELLGKMYPDLVRGIHSIGKTTEGRDIPAFIFGKGPVKAVMCGSMHAREHIATNFLMYLVDSYALAYTNNLERDGYSFREALDSCSFLIVPMVNPDGINLVQNGYDSTQNPEYLKELPVNSYGYRGWKSTVNGVDLNNNFDYLWVPQGSPSYGGYSGPEPASEPETRAMQELINSTDFKVFVSFHTQGQVIYWMDPNCDQSLAEKHEPYIERICIETGFDMMPSDGSYGVSGYMTDYIRYYKKAMAMTIELCPYIGDYPYPEEYFDNIAYPMRNIGLILAQIADEL